MVALASALGRHRSKVHFGSLTAYDWWFSAHAFSAMITILCLGGGFMCELFVELLWMPWHTTLWWLQLDCWHLHWFLGIACPEAYCMVGTLKGRSLVVAVLCLFGPTVTRASHFFVFICWLKDLQRVSVLTPLLGLSLLCSVSS